MSVGLCTEVSRCLLSCHRNSANLIIHSFIVTRRGTISCFADCLGSVSPGICSLSGNDSAIEPFGRIGNGPILIAQSLPRWTVRTWEYFLQQIFIPLHILSPHSCGHVVLLHSNLCHGKHLAWRRESGQGDSKKFESIRINLRVLANLPDRLIAG
jgi:hypothetical protein